MGFELIDEMESLDSRLSNADDVIDGRYYENCGYSVNYMNFWLN